VVIHGKPGVGKTQIALSYATDYRKEYDFIFLVDGRSEEDLKWSIASLDHRIPRKTAPLRSLQSLDDVDSHDAPNTMLPGRLEKVLQWLNLEGNTGWLLIIDNFPEARKERYDLSRYIPNADHGQILITTREALDLTSSAQLHLKGLNMEQSMRFYADNPAATIG
jgi:hypothetical protein